MAPINFHNLVVRDDNDSATIDDSTLFHLLIALVALLLVGSLCVGALFFLRAIRRRRAANQDTEKQAPRQSHRRARHPPSISIVTEKEAFLQEDSPPSSPVPEIRITFPEEQGKDGKRSSRVVVVKISDQGSIGYEPYQEHLPAYQNEDGERFHSLDLDSIGGLKEKMGPRRS